MATKKTTKPEELKVTKKPLKKQSTPSVGLTVPVYSLAGKEEGTMELPEEVFGAKINKSLIAQATRVYLNNLKGHFSNTKTRAEVSGSTIKIGAQKGGGRARHGSIRAPIFIGGGIALGPKFRKTVMDLPKKMKKAALKGALTVKFNDSQVFGINGIEKASGKTSQLKEFMNSFEKKSVLLIMDEKNEKLIQAARNLSNLKTVLASEFNILEVIRHEALILTKEAVKKLEERLKKEAINKP